MSKRHFFPTLYALAMVAALLLIAVFGVSAQDTSPTPYPTSTSYPTQTPYPTPTTEGASPLIEATGTVIPEGGVLDEQGGIMIGDPSVTWTISNQSFESNYPQGMTFKITLTSSAAPLTAARVVWTHAARTQNTLPVASINPDTGDLVAEWSHLDGQRPPWLAVDYHWEVTDEAGNRYFTPVVEEEYADNTREWVRLESDDIVVIAQNLPQQALQMAIDAMQTQRETFRQAWGGLLPFRPRAILFGDRAVWEEWQEGMVRQSVIGTTNLAWGATVQLAAGGDLVDLAYGTVPHEIEHMYQSWFSPFGFPTGTWSNEGNATFFELSQQYDYEGRVRQAAAAGQLPPLLNGIGPNPQGFGPDGGGRWGYDIGYTFFKWFVQIYGLDGHRELTQKLTSSSATLNGALEEVTGLTTEEIEAQWREWLGAEGAAPTLLPTFTPVVLSSPTPFVIPTQPSN